MYRDDPEMLDRVVHQDNRELEAPTEVSDLLVSVANQDSQARLDQLEPRDKQDREVLLEARDSLAVQVCLFTLILATYITRSHASIPHLSPGGILYIRIYTTRYISLYIISISQSYPLCHVHH